MGDARSIILAVRSSTLPEPCSSFSLSSGKYGVKFSNKALVLTFSGSSKFISETFNRAKYLSLSFGGLTDPDIVSPVLKLNFLICVGDT